MILHKDRDWTYLISNPLNCTLSASSAHFNDWKKVWRQSVWHFIYFCRMLYVIIFIFVATFREKTTRTIMYDWPSATGWEPRYGESFLIALGTLRFGSFMPRLKEMWDLSTMQGKLELSDESTFCTRWEWYLNSFLLTQPHTQNQNKIWNLSTVIWNVMIVPEGVRQIYLE